MNGLKAALAALYDFVRHAEPVAVAHAVSAVVALVVAFRAHQPVDGLAVAAWLAVQGALVRRVVTPVPNIPPGLAALVNPKP